MPHIDETPPPEEITDPDIPAEIARDTEVTAAVAAHAAASDPHTGYQKKSEKGGASGYMGLDSDSRGAQAPKVHATDHQAGGADALAIGEEFEICALNKAYSNVNFTTFQATNGAAYNAWRSSSSAQNDEVVFLLPLALRGGTWAFSVLYATTTTMGIYTVSTSVDGSTFTDQGTVDGYNGSGVNFNRSELTGLTVPAGTKFVRLKMATKNASSSSYGARFSGIGGVRTGA